MLTSLSMWPRGSCKSKEPGLLDACLKLQEDHNVQVASSEQLARDSEKWRQCAEDLTGDLAREAEITKGVLTRLDKVAIECEALRVLLEHERAARREATEALVATRAKVEDLSKKEILLRAEVGELQLRAGELHQDIVETQREKSALDEELLAARKELEEKQGTISALHVKMAKFGAENLELCKLKVLFELTTCSVTIEPLRLPMLMPEGLPCTGSSIMKWLHKRLATSVTSKPMRMDELLRIQPLKRGLDDLFDLDTVRATDDEELMEKFSTGFTVLDVAKSCDRLGVAQFLERATPWP